MQSIKCWVLLWLYEELLTIESGSFQENYMYHSRGKRLPILWDSFYTEWQTSICFLKSGQLLLNEEIKKQGCFGNSVFWLVIIVNSIYPNLRNYCSKRKQATIHQYTWGNNSLRNRAINILQLGELLYKQWRGNGSSISQSQGNYASLKAVQRQRISNISKGGGITSTLWEVRRHRIFQVW